MRWGCLFSRSIWRDCGAGSACSAAAEAEPHASPWPAPRRGAEGRVGRPDLAFRVPPSQLGIPRPARVPCIARPARVTYIRRPAGVPHIMRPVVGRRIGRRLRRGDGRVLGRGGGPPGNAGRRRVCAPREEVPLKSPADGLDPFGMRHTGRARGRLRRARRHRPSSARARCGACRRSRCGRARARGGRGPPSAPAPRAGQARPSCDSASVRRVSIAMSALSPSAPGSRVRSHSSAKRSVSRCRQIRPSMRSAQRPSAGRARAQRRARGIEGERSPPRERTRSTISSMVAPSSMAAATASWIAPGSGSSAAPPPIAPAVLRSLSHCVARIRAREDDRRMAQV